MVGHGPSVLSGLGAVIDAHTVIRLKAGLASEGGQAPPVEHFGTRTDYLCARNPAFDTGAVPFWLFDDASPAGRRWRAHYARFSDKKPSTGLCAVFVAVDAFAPEEIALIGFDRVLYGDGRTGKWYREPCDHLWGHDAPAERRCLESLIRIIDLNPRVHG